MTNDDFAFVAGDWDSVQRRLATLLSGADDWYEFAATLSAQVLLDGNATFDVLKSEERDLEGITLRLYDPDEKVWRIWWASKTSGGHLDTPVVGAFVDGVGTFECDDVYRGTPVRVRYRWSQTDIDHPRWEQSFSTDGGGTWEVNWVATFTRRTPTTVP
jgi:hypothetical protein